MDGGTFNAAACHQPAAEAADQCGDAHVFGGFRANVRIDQNDVADQRLVAADLTEETGGVTGGIGAGEIPDDPTVAVEDPAEGDFIVADRARQGGRDVAHVDVGDEAEVTVPVIRIEAQVRQVLCRRDSVGFQG